MVVAMDGLCVDSAQTLEEFQDLILRESYKVLLLCHSLTDEERRRALAMAAQLLPGVKVLALQGLAEIVCLESRVWRTGAGPQALRSKVQELTGLAG